jgi:thiamine phosphate synthase YjbQ (UPF0047 family)
MNVEKLHEGAVSRQAIGRLVVETRGPGFTEITHAVSQWAAGTGLRNGLLVAFCRHTSASLTVHEGVAGQSRSYRIISPLSFQWFGR